MYFKVFQALPLEMIDRIDYDDQTYTTLRAKILEIVKSDKLKRRFESFSFSEMRPSELLQEMTKRAGPNVPEKDVEPFWLDLLPDEMKSVGSLNTYLRHKAQEADKIYDKINEKKAEAKPKMELKLTAATNNEVQEFRKEIESLRAELAKMKKS